MQFTIDEVITRLNEFQHPDEIAAQCSVLGLREPDPTYFPRSQHCPLAQAYRVPSGWWEIQRYSYDAHCHSS